MTRGSATTDPAAAGRAAPPDRDCGVEPVPCAADERRARRLLFAAGFVLVVAHALAFPRSEPMYNGDETRHVTTAVWFRDLLADGEVLHARSHAERWYLQYPALGLLVWPPLFHALTGIAMLACGTSIVVARAGVLLFAALACGYLYRLVRRTHGTDLAAAAMLLCGLTPLVFTYSRYVMLEVPTLAWGLAATFHFVRFLDEGRGRDVFLAAAAAACAALTRIDAAYLLPLFGLLLAVRRRWDVLRRRETWLAALAALVLVAPYHAVAAKHTSGLHAQQATDSVVPEHAALGFLERATYYPAHVPTQVGWGLTLALLAAFPALRDPAFRRRNLTHLCTIVATYVTFAPLAETEFRHTIYWVPAIVVLGLDGTVGRLHRAGRAALVPIAAALLFVSTGLSTAFTQRPEVNGYAAAARFVLDETRGDPVCLFDGWLDGNFTYQMRRLDPERRFWVLRGDKLFYNFLCFPGTGFKAYAETDQELLDTLFRHDPEFVVVESPQIREPIAIAERLRTVLAEHPERFRLERTVPVSVRTTYLPQFDLLVYRNLARNPHPQREFDVELLGLGRTLSGRRPGRGSDAPPPSPSPSPSPSPEVPRIRQ